MTIAPTRRRAAIAFILVTAVIDIMAMGIIIPVLPQLIEEFAGSQAGAGWINGVFVALWALMQFSFSPIMGSLSDQYGRRPVILLSAAGLAADYVLMALAPNLWWLALGRLIAGATSASFTTINAYMADITPPEGRARAYGQIGAAFAVGFIAGPLVGGLLGEISARAPFWAAAALSAVAFLYGLFVLPESLAPENRMQFSWKRANPFGALMLLRRHVEMSGLAVVTFMLHFAHHVFSVVYVLYAYHRYGLSPAQVGILLAIAGSLDAVVQGALVGPMVKRFGDRTIMVFGLFGGAWGLAAMAFAPNAIWFALALAPNALWGFAMPTLQSLMTQLVSEREQGQLQGATMCVASIAGVSSPLFFGWVYSQTTSAGSDPAFSGVAFLISAAILALGAIIGWSVARRAAQT